MLGYYLTVQSGAGLQPGVDMAYYHLGRGELELAAKEQQGGNEQDHRVLRLAAASDGAPAEVIKAALALPLDQGIDVETIWTALALALRERQDPAPYLAAIRDYKNREHSRSSTSLPRCAAARVPPMPSSCSTVSTWRRADMPTAQPS